MSRAGSTTPEFGQAAGAAHVGDNQAKGTTFPRDERVKARGRVRDFRRWVAENPRGFALIDEAVQGVIERGGYLGGHDLAAIIRGREVIEADGRLSHAPSNSIIPVLVRVLIARHPEFKTHTGTLRAGVYDVLGIDWREVS